MFLLYEEEGRGLQGPEAWTFDRGSQVLGHSLVNASQKIGLLASSPLEGKERLSADIVRMMEFY